MSVSAHTSRSLGSSIVCAIAAALIAVPLASASGSQGLSTEHSATQNRVDLLNASGQLDPWMYPLLLHTTVVSTAAGRSTDRFVTENSAGQNRGDQQGTDGRFDAWQRHMHHEDRVYGASGRPSDRLITENSASQNRPTTFRAPPSVSAPVASPNRSAWIDIAVGAAGTLALALLAAGAVFAVRRTRGRFAPVR